MKYIKKIVEPESLLLIWQGPGVSSESRKKRVVGRLYRDLGMEKVNLEYFNETIDFGEAISFGFDGYSPLDKKIRYHFDILHFFLKRLPSRSRRDFRKYLDSIRVNNVNISDFALLGYSQAKLPTDGFSLVNTFEGVTTDFEFLSEVAGARYHWGEGNPDGSSTVQLVLEDENEYDSKAVRVDIDGKKAGYLNRVIALKYREWIAYAKVRASVEKFYRQEGCPCIWIYVEVQFD